MYQIFRFYYDKKSIMKNNYIKCIIYNEKM